MGAPAKQPYLEFSAERHEYYLDGARVPSVTEVLCKGGLVSPFAQRHEIARWRGQSVHEVCAAEDLGEPWDLRRVPAELRGYIKAWRAFKQATGLDQWTLVEHKVYSYWHGYAGTLDRLAPTSNSGGRPVLVELKTRDIPGWTGLQLAGYGIALDRHQVFGRIAVGLKADGAYKLKSYPVGEYHRDARGFLRLLDQVKGEQNAS